jgi:hypothetical protein
MRSLNYHHHLFEYDEISENAIDNPILSLKLTKNPGSENEVKTLSHFTIKAPNYIYSLGSLTKKFVLMKSN